MKTIRLLTIWLVAICLLLGISPTKTEAHGYIVRATPQDRSVLSRAPNQVQIWFSEGLERDFSTISVFNQTGEQVDLGDGRVDEGNSAKLVVSLPTNLPNGVYLVKIRPVFTSDGHAVSDTLVFWVGEQIGSVEASGTSNTAIPLEALWRVLLTVALTVMFGTTLMYVAVLRPAWGNNEFSLGHLPPRVMRRLSRLLWGSLLLAIGVNLLALMQTAMSLFEASPATVFRDELWNIVLAGTNFGDVWKFRMVLLAIMLGVQIVAAQQARNRPFSTHILWLVNGVLGFVTLSTMSLISHASGTPTWGILSLLIDYLHLTAVAVWIGGLIVLVLVLRPALSPLDGAARGQAILALLRRFSPLAAASLSLVIVTGIYSSLWIIDTPKNISGTTYGLTLLSKWILMLPLVGLGAVHFIVVSPERSQKATDFLHAHQRFSTLPNTLRFEMVFALAVLFAAGWLPATPPPIPQDFQQGNQAPKQTLTIEGYDVTLSVDPAAMGANSYDVRVNPSDVEDVNLRFYNAPWGAYTIPLTLDKIETNTWGGASGEIDIAGEWYALVDFVPVGETTPLRAAFRWDFVEEINSGRTPSILNWLSLAAIIAVILAWLLPFVSHMVTALNWTPETVVVGVVALGLTIAALIGGAIELNRIGENVDQQRNQPPDVVNPIFPDQASLTAGHALYDAECVRCHGEDGQGNLAEDIPALLKIDRDDEDLLRILSRGIVNHHDYGTGLTTEEHWNLINFLRTLEQ